MWRWLSLVHAWSRCSERLGVTSGIAHSFPSNHLPCYPHPSSLSSLAGDVIFLRSLFLLPEAFFGQILLSPPILFVFSIPYKRCPSVAPVDRAGSFPSLISFASSRWSWSLGSEGINNSMATSIQRRLSMNRTPHIHAFGSHPFESGLVLDLLVTNRMWWERC